MKCSKCSAEWNASVEVEKCPFCQADLTEKETIDILKEIIEENSLEIYNNPDEFKQKLAEKLGKDDIDYKYLVVMLDNKASIMIYTNREVEDKIFDEKRKDFIKNFAEEISMFTDKVDYYVNMLGEAFGKDVKITVFRYQNYGCYALEEDYEIVDGIIYEKETEYGKDFVEIPIYSVTKLIDESIIDVVVQKEIDGIPVKKVGTDAFRWCSKIESVKLFNDIEIENRAFSSCRNLTTLEVVGGNLQKVGDEAFSFCEKLRNIDLSNCCEIGEEAFYSCESFKYVEIPNCSRISKGAFKNCDQLKTVEISDCSIEDEAFYSCKELSSIELTKCKEVGKSAFAWCEKLISVNLPNCSKLGKEAFQYCKSLKKVSFLPSSCETVYRLEERVFDGCTNLEEVYLPEYLILIESQAFGDCENLKLVEFPTTPGFINQIAFHHEANIDIPDNWKEFSPRKSIIIGMPNNFWR